MGRGSKSGGKGLQAGGQAGRQAASRSFVALQTLKIAQENEFLLQTIQLFACCLLELILPPDHYTALTGRFAHTQERCVHACLHTHSPTIEITLL